jgi:hypothetical protein
MKRVRRASATFALIISLTLAGTVRAGDLVPFKGQGSFTGTSETVDPNTGNLIITGVVAGNLSHLGRTTGTATQITFAPDYVSFTIEVTFVAANGDELFATFEGNFVDSNFDSEGTFSITGGTGRFDGASGGGTFLSFNGAAMVQIDGEISTVGSGT